MEFRLCCKTYQLYCTNSSSYLVGSIFITGWLHRCLNIICSLTATSASSKVHPRSILLMSFWMIYCHDIFGQPSLLFLWDGFQWHSLLGILSMFICCKWQNHWMKAAYPNDCRKLGCSVLDLMVLLICGIIYSGTSPAIILLRLRFVQLHFLTT